MVREPHSAQEQFILDLWQSEDAQERCHLLQAHADQVNVYLVTALHIYANEASKMGKHHTAWDLMSLSQEVTDHLGDLKLMGDCHSQAGLLHFRQGALVDAPRSWEIALTVYEKADADATKSACLTNLGIACRNLGDLTKAQDFEMQALALHRQLNLPQGEVLNLGELGLIFHDLGDAQQGLRYLEQALELSRAIGFRQAEANQLGNIGVVRRDQGEIPKALAYLEQALAVHCELEDQRGEANQLGNIGVAYRDLGEFPKS
jgi:tetratricopeptide (TPR) repeat protein